MTPGAYCDGIQHVGIPTDHLENTIHFYEDLIPGHLKDLCSGKEPACSFFAVGKSGD